MKNKKGQTGTVILSGIIAVIVGVAMLPVFTSLIDDAQSTASIDLEQLTNTAYNHSFTLDHDDLIVGSIVVLNATGFSGTNRTDLLSDGNEYALNELTGVIQIINRTGIWNVSYDYEPATYVDSTTGRTVVKQITLMYAVFLILLTLAAVGIIVMKK